MKDVYYRIDSMKLCGGEEEVLADVMMVERGWEVR